MNPKFEKTIELFQHGKLDDAMKSCLEIIDKGTQNFDIFHLTGIIFYLKKNYIESELYINKAIAINSKNAEAYNNLGIVQKELNNFNGALESFNKAININKYYAEAYNNRGMIMIERENLNAALDNWNKAIEINPKFSEAYNNKSNTLHRLGDFNAALYSSDIAIKINPNYAEAYNNRSYIYKELRNLNDALNSTDKAIEINPQYADAHNSRGIILKDLRRFDEALESYDTAIKIEPNHLEAHNNRGYILRELKLLNESVKSFIKSIKINPNAEFILSKLIQTKLMLCDWSFYYENIKKLEINIVNEKKSPILFSILSIYDSLELQKKSVEIFLNKHLTKTSEIKPFIKKKNNTKIRIGYYSADFRDHPVALQIVQLIELHDKSNFEIIGFSFGPGKKSKMRERLSDAFDEFYDVETKSDDEIVELSRELDIDIAIDLMGFTQYNRFGIFLLGCAPIQINYLGYSGTIASNCIDYIIGDKNLIPLSIKHLYSEKIIYLPNSFMINDSTKKISKKIFNKSEFNLPVNGFIFCCFNNHYKITPDMFDIWMKLLIKIPSSVIWLSKGNIDSVSNLRKEAKKRTVDPNRLIFAERMSSLADHLGRHKLADLFLDTLPYNAHATCSDALWSGLPVLTLSGQSFASRVATSMLKAIQLDELITSSKEEYETKAIELATNPEKLKEIKKKLEINIVKSSLFNTKLYTKNIEASFKKIYKRYIQKLKPDDIEII